MLHEFFYWLVNMSISAALCGIAVVLLRKLRCIPRRFSLLMWAIPLLRMTVPFGMRGRLTLMELAALLHSRQVELPETSFGTAMNHMGLADSYFPLEYPRTIIYRVFTVGGIIWLIGAAALIIAFLMIYLTTLSELKSATPAENGTFVSEKVTCPAVYGILRPRIILPVDYDAEELVLLHERTHLKRGDNLWRFIAFIAAAIHWFNPLTWLFLKLFLEDVELACDEAVLASCGEEKRKEYAMLLVCSAEKTDVFASAFGGAKLRLRAKSILSYKKLTLASIVTSALFICCVFYALLAN